MARQSGTRAYSDAAIKAGTGRTLGAWFKVLDAFDVRAQGHTAAARHLNREHGLRGWWAQMVTVRYEYEHGLRQAQVPPPAELSAALKRSARARKAFAALTAYQQSRTAQWIGAAKRPETRTRRIARTIEALHEGKPPPGI